MKAGRLRHKLRIEEKRVISIDPYSGLEYLTLPYVEGVNQG